MLIIPAMNTAGEQIGTWSFPQPCDYLHFDVSVHGQAVMDEVLKTDCCMWAGVVQEKLEESRRECLAVAMGAYENKLETAQPEWWKNMHEKARLPAVAQLLVQLSPAWDLSSPAYEKQVLLVPNEDIGSVLHVSTFGDRRLREALSTWTYYWRKRA